MVHIVYSISIYIYRIYVYRKTIYRYIVHIWHYEYTQHSYVHVVCPNDCGAEA